MRTLRLGMYTENIVKQEIDDIKRKVNMLYEENKEMHITINKAIKLIEENICGGSISNANKLLKILKGE